MLHSWCSSCRSVLFFYIILIRNTVWKKPLMLFQCSLRMTSLGILSKMALKQNFKNGATLSALLGLICSVLLPSTTLNISLLSSPSWLFITRGALLGRTGLQTNSINPIGKTSLSKLLMLQRQSCRRNLSVILLRLLLAKRKFTFFPEGGAEVSEVREVHVEVHVAVEVVVHQAVVLPPILSQRSARRCLVLGRSALLNIVSVRRVSKPLRKVNKRRQITVILVQMLQLKFAVRDTARTRSNVLRMLPDGVMQQKHMRAR